MKKRYFFVLSVFLPMCLIMGCASSSTPAPANNEVSSEIELTQELWEDLMDYNFELATVEAISKESYAQLDKALTDGTINTVKLRKRVYEITLIEANTIKFIDSKPQYVLLHQFMWDEHKAPSLAWAIPESEGDEVAFEQHLQGYIARHYDIVEEFYQFLKTKAKELDIELHYEPKL